MQDDTATETFGPLPEPAGAGEWAIVEVFGHRRHAGRIAEHERFGTKMLRIDVPSVRVEASVAGPVYSIEGWTTHYYGGATIFSLTPTDEAAALRINMPYVAESRYTLAPPHQPITPDDFETEDDFAGSAGDEPFDPDAGSDIR